MQENRKKMQDKTPPENGKKPEKSAAEKENAAQENKDASAAEGDQQQDRDAAALEALLAENAEMKDKMLRALAEVENIRRRSQKEREDTAKYAVTSFARDLVTVADNLRRALDSVPEEAAAGNELLQNILTGVAATEKQLLSALENAGIVKIMPGEEKFDPNFHEVMFEAEIPGKTAGHIIEVLEPGYMIHDRLLRPARVGVAKSTAAKETGKESGKTEKS